MSDDDTMNPSNPKDLADLKLRDEVEEAESESGDAPLLTYIYQAIELSLAIPMDSPLQGTYTD